MLLPSSALPACGMRQHRRTGGGCRLWPGGLAQPRQQPLHEDGWPRASACGMSPQVTQVNRLTCLVKDFRARHGSRVSNARSANACRATGCKLLVGQWALARVAEKVPVPKVAPLRKQAMNNNRIRQNPHFMSHHHQTQMRSQCNSSPLVSCKTNAGQTQDSSNRLHDVTSLVGPCTLNLQRGGQIQTQFQTSQSKTGAERVHGGGLRGSGGRMGRQSAGKRGPEDQGCRREHAVQERQEGQAEASIKM